MTDHQAPRYSQQTIDVARNLNRANAEWSTASDAAMRTGDYATERRLREHAHQMLLALFFHVIIDLNIDLERMPDIHLEGTQNSPEGKPDHRGDSGTSRPAATRAASDDSAEREPRTGHFSGVIERTKDRVRLLCCVALHWMRGVR